MWRPNTAKNPTKSCAKALVIFATCSWPSLCEQSELQCWRRNRRLCGPAQISAARALLPTFDISILNTLPFMGAVAALPTCFSGFPPISFPPKTYANTTHPPFAVSPTQPQLVSLLPVGARRAHRAQPRHANKHRFQQLQQQMAGGCHQSRHQRP